MTTTHDDKAREPAPCPFCGAELLPAENDYHGAHWRHPGNKMLTYQSCMLEGERIVNVEFWNRRAALSPASTGQEAGPDLFKAEKLVPYEIRYFGTPGMAEKLGYTVIGTYYRAAPAQQVEAEIRDKALEEAARRLENAYFGCNDWLRLRQFTAEIRALKSAAGSNNGEKGE